MTDKIKQTLVEKAKPECGAHASDPHVLAAVILAQAMDRLGEQLIQAGAVAQYRRS